MTTWRKVRTYWTETKRVINGRVKQTTCCCAAPGSTRSGCRIVQGNKTPCRCFCHSNEHYDEYEKRKRRIQ